jgi:hypothetical protein
MLLSKTEKFCQVAERLIILTFCDQVLDGVKAIENEMRVHLCTERFFLQREVNRFNDRLLPADLLSSSELYTLPASRKSVRLRA